MRSAGKWAAVAGAAAGAALVPTGAAQANVVGVGNATIGNSCANLGTGAEAHGATFADSGIVSGNYAALPLSLPRNNCGNSGIVCTAVFMAIL
ncbi:DUF320 domain-containing protein [Streptomyces sp. SID3343]|nr:DUF320 domain-containing protein [Streptomyces sp. SID3343]